MGKKQEKERKSKREWPILRRKGKEESCRLKGKSGGGGRGGRGGGRGRGNSLGQGKARHRGSSIGERGGG